MPYKPQQLCKWPRCKELAESRETYCPTHKQEAFRQYKEQNRKRQQTYDRNRPEWHKWYNTSRWRVESKTFLQANPLCVCQECKERNRIIAATVVDHIEPHKGDYDKFWDQSNWQPMAKRCHDRKTAREDGGWGNERK